MERKRLFAVGVDGSPEVSELPTDATWISSGSDGGAYVLGMKERSEDDAQRALQFALHFLESRHRACVKYVNVEIQGSTGAINWSKEIDTELKRLEPGEVSVAPDLAKIYARLFVFEPVENQEELWLLCGDRRRPTRTRGLTAQFGTMIGRQDELSRLRELVQQVGEDQGQIVALCGAAGIGKTRLKMSFWDSLKKEQIEAYEGVYQLRKTETYQGFRQIISALLEKRGTKLDALGVTIAELDYLELLTKPGTIPEHLHGLSDEDLKEGLFFAVRKVIHHAAKTPLILLFEDVHWADPGSIELLEYLMEEMEKTKLLLVLVHRPETEGAWTKRLNYTELEIRPFDQPELELFVKDISSVDRVPQMVVSMMENISLGNPLFVEEMLRHLLESKALEVQTLDNEEKLLGGKSPELSDIPSTLHSLIASRFDRLPQETKIALRWAAVLGATVEYREYVDLLKEEMKEDPSKEIQHLIDHRYLYEKSAFPTQEYQFTHDLIHAVVLENIPPAEAEVFHRTVGEFLQKRHPNPSFDVLSRMAEHHLQGDDTKAAVQTALKAGEVALSIFRLKQAEYFLSEALQRWKEHNIQDIEAHTIYPLRVKVSLEHAALGTAEQVLEEWKKHGIKSDPAIEVDYWLLEMRLKQAQRKHEDTLAAAKTTLELFEKTGDESERRFRVAEARMFALYDLARKEESVSEGRRALDEIGDKFPEIRVSILALLAFLCAQGGDRDAAIGYLKKAENLLSPTMSPRVQFQFARNVGLTCEALELRQEQFRAYDRTVDIAKAAGMRGSYVQALTMRGSGANEVGDFNLLFQDLEEALRQGRQMKSFAIAELALFNLVDALNDLGATNEVLERWKEFKKDFPHPIDLRQANRRLALEATTAEMLGDYARAVKLRKEAAKIFEQMGNIGPFGRAQFQVMKVEATGQLRPISEIVSDYNKLAGELKNTQAPIAHYARRETAYILASLGGDPSPAPDFSYNTLACPNSYYKQYLTAAKIRWLDSIGKTTEANELREKYRIERERMKERIPMRYHASFDSHPLYKVPQSPK